MVLSLRHYNTLQHREKGVTTKLLKFIFLPFFFLEGDCCMRELALSCPAKCLPLHGPALPQPCLAINLDVLTAASLPTPLSTQRWTQCWRGFLVKADNVSFEHWTRFSIS